MWCFKSLISRRNKRRLTLVFIVLLKVFGGCRGPLSPISPTRVDVEMDRITVYDTKGEILFQRTFEGQVNEVRVESPRQEGGRKCE